MQLKPLTELKWHSQFPHLPLSNHYHNPHPKVSLPRGRRNGLSLSCWGVSCPEPEGPHMGHGTLIHESRITYQILTVPKIVWKVVSPIPGLSRLLLFWMETKLSWLQKTTWLGISDAIRHLTPSISGSHPDGVTSLRTEYTESIFWIHPRHGGCGHHDCGWNLFPTRGIFHSGHYRPP
jgi:hypothetical protein